MHRTTNSLSGLVGMAAVVIVTVLFFALVLLPFIADLHARLAPALAVLAR